MSRLPPNKAIIMTRQTAVASTASSGPTDNSLPQGAGKWPIIKLKLSFAGPIRPSKTPDSSTPAPEANKLSRYAHLPFFKSGVTMPEIMQIKMLKNGKLYTNGTGYSSPFCLAS